MTIQSWLMYLALVFVATSTPNPAGLKPSTEQAVLFLLASVFFWQRHQTTESYNNTPIHLKEPI